MLYIGENHTISMPEKFKRGPSLVKDVMNAKVVIAKPEATAKEAAKVMAEAHIGALVVLSGTNIAGIVTESDLIRKIIAEGNDAAQTRLDQMMTKNVKTIEADRELEEAADMMVENNIKKLPVVKGGKLVGILTSTDLISFEPKFIESLSQLLMLKPRESMAG